MSGRDGWSVNQTWSPEIAEMFYTRLKRARNKSMHLLWQISNIKDSRPEVALELIEHYFAQDNTTLAAAILRIQGDARAAVGDALGAADSYEAAIAQEEADPGVISGAETPLALLIARERMEEKYDRALNLLEQRKNRLVFPQERFEWNAALALLLDAFGSPESAQENAEYALQIAELKEGPSSRHPTLGIVGPQDAEIVTRVAELAGRPARRDVREVPPPRRFFGRK